LTAETAMPRLPIVTPLPIASAVPFSTVTTGQHTQSPQPELRRRMIRRVPADCRSKRDNAKPRNPQLFPPESG
jgi:hypothetical protein